MKKESKQRIRIRTVVGIHDGMDETIQQYSDKDITIIIDIGIEPIEQKDGGMMVHM